MTTMEALQYLTKEQDAGKKKSFMEALPVDTLKEIKTLMRALFPSASVKEKSAEQITAESELAAFEKEYAEVLKEHAVLRTEVKKFTGHIRKSEWHYDWVDQAGLAAKAGSGFVKVRDGAIAGKLFDVRNGSAWANQMVQDGGFTDGQIAAVNKAMRAVKPKATLVKAGS